MKLYLEKIHLPLKVNWKLSRNQTTWKENFIVHLETELGEFRSEVAPNIRYGETVEKIETQFNLWKAETSIDNLVNAHLLEVELNKVTLFHSLRFGLESAFLSYYAKKEGKTLSDYLDLPPVLPLSTSYSVPIMPIEEIFDYIFPLKRFQSLKVKVNAETGLEMLQEISRYTQVKLRVDGNEAWKDFDQFMRFQEALKDMNIELIEQPFPSSMEEEYRQLKKSSPYVLLADESIEDVGDFSELSRQFHAVNIKLMKTGSLIKARDLLLEAKKHKMKAMIGCMIETSLGISYGTLFGGMVDYVDLDGFLLLKEDPFHLVKELEGVLETNF